MRRRMLGASLLALALSSAASAGDMQNGVAAGGYIPNDVAASGNMPNDAPADGIIPNDPADTGVFEAAMLTLRFALGLP